MLSLAQRCNAVLGALLLGAMAVFWGAGREGRVERLAGPRSAVGFLRRRKWSFRLLGSAIMLLAIVGSVVVAVLAFCATWVRGVTTYNLELSPWMAIAAWVGLDYVFLQGRRLWSRLP
jgi:hypothetical protein